MLKKTLTAAVAITALLAVSACSKPAVTPAEPTPATPALNAPSSAPASAAPSTPAGPRTPATPATNLDAITVSDDAKPVMKFAAPFGIDQTRTKVLKPGTGATVGAGAVVEVLYSGVNGADGVEFDENFTAGKTAAFSLDQVVPGFKKGLEGQKVGSRVLIGMPAADGYAQGNPQAGIQVGDNLLFVVDIVSASLSEPQGESQPQDPALPQVGGDAAKPVVTIPAGFKAPEDTVSKLIIAGHGQAVQATDNVFLHYQTVSAKTGQVIEQSYGGKPQTAPLSRMIPGFSKGLVGKNVGSRVLIVVPAKDAYGSQGNATPSIAPDDTLIFVVDLLYVPKAQ